MPIKGLQETYLNRLITGEWTGTMNLTEPQAGSDVGALRTRAVPHADGSYRVEGSKIYITWGEHDAAANIVHLVLARLPDAPPGTKGISLFLCPKFLPAGDGTFTVRNDLRAVGVEHKLGIHASPTCTMAFGEHGNCVGFLVGDEGGGMRAMFTMMNHARDQRRPAGRRDRRARAAGRDRLCPRPGPVGEIRGGRRRGPYRRARRRPPDADDRAQHHRGGPRADLFHRRRGRPRPCGRRPRRQGTRRPFDPGDQGVGDRHGRRGREPVPPGLWRHGLCRGDRRGAAPPRCAHRADL